MSEENATTIDALKKKQVAPEATLPDVQAGFGNLQSFNLLQRQATSLSQASLVPEDFRGNIPNSIIALELAGRMKASPLMVMQNLYVVYGRPGWSSQFLIATFNTCARFTTMQFRFQGEQGNDEWGCRAFATEVATGLEILGPLVTIGMAKAEGWYDRQSKKGAAASKWPTMPELMLTYRAAAFFVRIYAPELSMGLQTREELSDLDPEKAVESTYSVTADELRNGNGQDTEPEASIEATTEPAEPTEGQPAQDPADAEGRDEADPASKSEAERLADGFDAAEAAEVGGNEPDDPVISAQKAGSLPGFASQFQVTADDLARHIEECYNGKTAKELTESEYKDIKRRVQETK